MTRSASCITASRRTTGFDKQHIPMHITDGVGMIQLSIRKQFPDFVPPPRRRSAIAEAASVGESEYTLYDRRVADIATQWLRDAAGRRSPGCCSSASSRRTIRWSRRRIFRSLSGRRRCPIRNTDPAPAISRIRGSPICSRAASRARRTSARWPPISAWSASWTRKSAVCSTALDEAGLRGTTRMLYTSDHGENAGVRGLWGKSNHYQEAVGVPMIVAGRAYRRQSGVRRRYRSSDGYPTILDGGGLSVAADGVPGRSLFDIAAGRRSRAHRVFRISRRGLAIGILRCARALQVHLLRPQSIPSCSTSKPTRRRAPPRAAAGIRRDPEQLEALLRTIVDPEAGRSAGQRGTAPTDRKQGRSRSR